MPPNKGAFWIQALKSDQNLLLTEREFSRQFSGRSTSKDDRDFLVYHESAREIVFRNTDQGTTASTESSYHESKHEYPAIRPLPELPFGPADTFPPLEESSSMPQDDWTDAECDVVQFLQKGQAVVKTIKNADWASFLDRFKTPQKAERRYLDSHIDIPPKNDIFCFNSFVTSTTLLPESGKKMRCFGSTKDYTVGVVFALPNHFVNETEEDAALRTHTWSWPSGYSAKTEFNIDSRGELINGRKEALVPFCGLRRQNNSYLHDHDYEIAGKLIQGGLSCVPYNEVYLRIGGLGRIVNDVDFATGEDREENENNRSFESGVGLPIALFVRSTRASDLVAMIRTRSRMCSRLQRSHVGGIPLLLIAPDLGVKVFSRKLFDQFLHIMANDLNSFQNPSIAHRTTVDRTCEDSLKQKSEELINLDADNIRQVLSLEECSRLAGGFGATDNSLVNLFMDSVRRECCTQGSKDIRDGQCNPLRNLLQEALTSAVRSGDYHISRQLLIYYTIVISRTLSRKDGETHLFSLPPPPIDTHALLSATKSPGLLAVLGAAEILKGMYHHTVRSRLEEAIVAVDEWIEQSESVRFRVASWREQLVAQAKLHINTADESHFMAFVSDKAILNRKKFSQQLCDLVAATELEDVAFLQCLSTILSGMNQPCLRLEILQFVLGLDNRYSLSHLIRSVELAATVLLEAGDGENPNSLFDFLKRKSLAKRKKAENAEGEIPPSDSPWSHFWGTDRAVAIAEEIPLKWNDFCSNLSWLKPKKWLNNVKSTNIIAHLPRALSTSLLSELVGNEEELTEMEKEAEKQEISDEVYMKLV